MGYNPGQLGSLLATGVRLTYAVLPGLPRSAECARMVRAAGMELIVHMPMEPLGGEDPGPLALRRGMGRGEILRNLEAALASVPGATGMNNHMGSAATADPAIMYVVMEFCRSRGLRYLDSRTTAQSAVRAAAAKAGEAVVERSVFLDNAQDRPSMITAIREGFKKAERNGYAVMIGHVWSSELAQAITDMYPELVDRGFSLSTIAGLVTAGDDGAD